LAIVPAAGNITETGVHDIPMVTGATAMTLFVRQPKTYGGSQQIHKIKIIRSPPLTSHWNSRQKFRITTHETDCKLPLWKWSKSNEVRFQSIKMHKKNCDPTEIRTHHPPN